MMPFEKKDIKNLISNESPTHADSPSKVLIILNLCCASDYIYNQKNYLILKLKIYSIKINMKMRKIFTLFETN